MNSKRLLRFVKITDENIKMKKCIKLFTNPRSNYRSWVRSTRGGNIALIDRRRAKTGEIVTIYILNYRESRYHITAKFDATITETTVTVVVRSPTIVRVYCPDVHFYRRYSPTIFPSINWMPFFLFLVSITPNLAWPYVQYFNLVFRCPDKSYSGSILSRFFQVCSVLTPLFPLLFVYD